MYPWRRRSVSAVCKADCERAIAPFSRDGHQSTPDFRAAGQKRASSTCVYRRDRLMGDVCLSKFIFSLKCALAGSLAKSLKGSHKNPNGFYLHGLGERSQQKIYSGSTWGMEKLRKLPDINKSI